MSPRTVSHSSITVHPKDVHATIGKHMLADGEHLIIDLAGSHGPYLRDEATGREYLDFYAYFASMPIDVSAQLRSLGAFVCARVEDMLSELVDAAAERNANRSSRLQENSL